MSPVMPDERYEQFRPKDAGRDLHAHGRRWVGSDDDWHPNIVPTLLAARTESRPETQMIVLNTITCYGTGVHSDRV